jgi:hypothetical protein
MKADFSRKIVPNRTEHRRDTQLHRTAELDTQSPHTELPNTLNNRKELFKESLHYARQVLREVAQQAEVWNPSEETHADCDQ